MFLCGLCLMLIVSMVTSANMSSWNFSKWSDDPIQNTATGTSDNSQDAQTRAAASILPINEALTENTGAFSNAVLMTGTNVNGIVAQGGSGIASLAFDTDADTDGVQAYQIATDEMVTFSWVSYQGWVNSKTDSIVIRNSEGKAVFAYAYDLNKCNITDVQIGGVTAPLFESFFDQGYVGSKSANGWVAKTGQAYLADNANNTVVTVKVFGLGYVEVNMKNEKRSIDNTYSAMLPEGFKVDLASLDIVNVSTNADRSLGINSLSIVSGESTVQLAGYTVNRQLEDGTAIDSYTATNIAGLDVALPQAAWYDQNGKKYIYVSDDAAKVGVLVEGNVYTITYREAAVYNYVIGAVDDDALPFVEELIKGTAYEGDNVTIGYPRYQIKDGQLMQAATTGSEYRMSWTPTADNDTKYITYTPVEGVTDVVYLTEAENLNSYSIGLLTTSNAAVRASAAKAAYAKYNINLTKLNSGKYKIVAGLFDATSTPSYTAAFAIANDTVATVTAASVNLSEETAEFNLAADNSYITWQASGSENQGLDYVYIQRIGEAEYTSVASVAEVKNLKSNTPVALTLTDAKLTYSTADEGCKNPYGYSYLEEGNEGIALNYALTSALEWTSGNTVTGTLYAIVTVDGYGRPRLDVAGKSSASEVNLTPAEITPTAATVAQLKDAEWQKNYGKLFELKDVKWAKVKVDEYTINYYLVSGEDSVQFKDNMYVLPENLPTYEKFNSIQGYVDVTYEGDVVFVCNGVYDAVVAPAIRVENIGALKEVESGADVLLTLDNAVVSVMLTGHMGEFILLEDKTGGIQLTGADYWGEGGLANILGITNDSTSVKGQLYCRYTNAYGTIRLSENDSTSASTVKIEKGVAVTPTVVSLADAVSGKYDMRLLRINNLHMSYDAQQYMQYLVSGETRVAVYDQFATMTDMETWEPIVIENLKSITGITIPATEYQPATFAPISYEAQIYKTFAENTVLLMTAENVAAAVAEGWATGGATRVDNKKGNVDPATGEATEKATAFAGIGLKSGNDAKAFAVDVTGVEQIVAYGVTTSSSATRTLSVTATDSKGNKLNAKGSTAPNETAVVTLNLDKSKAYTIDFTGLDGETGADIALHGIKFIVDNPTLGISDIQTQTLNSNNIYNLNGVMVRKAGESLQGLQKGIYIINNKKVVVK